MGNTTHSSDLNLSASTCELNKTINQFESDDISFESSPLKQHENNSTLYLKNLFSNNKGLDMRLGVRKLKHNRLMIVDSSIEFKDNMIYVTNEQYPETPGLIELLFTKPQMNHS
ncbi:hypothetical protein PV326_011297 [Microctonus aethiopoides]|nr:hypothetical protein PV326_011297 [Microctonus aethiopoides]